MQGTAAADGKSLLLHQIESLMRLCFFGKIPGVKKTVVWIFFSEE